MTTQIKPGKISHPESQAKGVRVHSAPKALKDKASADHIDTDAHARAYNKLISGNIKATSTSVTEMLNMIDSAEAGTAVMEDPVQSLISSLLMGRGSGAQTTASSSFEVPYVPDLKDLLRSNPELEDNIEPLLERYQAQRDTLDDLLKYADKFLAPPTAAQMTPDEISALWEHKKGIESALSENKRQLGDALFYYEWAKAKKAAAEEEAKKKPKP